jgi:transcriptional regulator GlxA family with amidase domain
MRAALPLFADTVCSRADSTAPGSRSMVGVSGHVLDRSPLEITRRCGPPQEHSKCDDLPMGHGLTNQAPIQGAASGGQRPRRPISRIAIVVFDGFDELDAVGPFEVLTNAIRAGATADVRLVRLEGPGEVRASHGLRVTVADRLDSEADLVIVSGGGWNSPPGTPGARAEVQRGQLPSAIARLHADGATVASVCTGALIVAASGLLKGRPATTHHEALHDLAAAGASLVDARVVDAGDVLTAGGVTSGLDLALWLVEREWGEDMASAVASQIEHERVGTVWTGTE